MCVRVGGGGGGGKGGAAGVQNIKSYERVNRVRYQKLTRGPGQIIGDVGQARDIIGRERPHIPQHITHTRL